MSEQITASSKVTLHFALKLSSGDVVDSTFGGKAASFVMGDGSLLPGFEAKLIGLSAGDEATFEILPEEGFGQLTEANYQTVKRELFDESEALEVGMVMSFANGPEGELPGVIHDITDDEVVVNFNHPLSGETLTFEVRIEEVAS